MCAIYFMSFLDRTNVALAKAQLAADLGISAAAYGLGAGIFFIGYALLEVPSNLAAHRVGPRRWIARIAVTWGMLSDRDDVRAGRVVVLRAARAAGHRRSGTFSGADVHGDAVVRAAGPAVAVGWIYTAPALALMLGNPLGGALMQLDGFGGLHGWQWMFLLEGIADRARRRAAVLQAAGAAARRTLALGRGSAMRSKRAPSSTRTDMPELFSADWIAALKRPTTVLIGLIYFLNQVAFVGLYFFTPAIIQQMHVNRRCIVGLLSSSVGIGFLLGVLILPRIHRRMSNDCVYLGILTAGLVVSAVRSSRRANPVGAWSLLLVHRRSSRAACCRRTGPSR